MGTRLKPCPSTIEIRRDLQAAEKVAVASGPQRLKPGVFQLITYGLKAVPFNNLSFSAACKAQIFVGPQRPD
jgi:hypothetical protein